MNIKYHLMLGLAAEAILGDLTGTILFISMAPDLTLLFNELKIRIKRQKFDPYHVDPYSFALYHTAHSLIITIILLSVEWGWAVAHLIHIIPDWFTHTGRFSAMPFYPLSDYKLKCGREVLK